MSAGALDFYVPGSSRLHRLDPRVKLFVVAAWGVVMFFWTSLVLLVVALAAIHLALLASGYPRGRLLTIWRAIAVLLTLIVVIWPLFDRSGEVWFSLGPLDITRQGVLRGIVNATRIAGINFIFILWVGTTGPRELVRGFVRLGLPFRWGMALTIGLRFIPTFAGTWATVSDAQQARGLVLEGWWFRKVRLMLPIFVAALVSAFRSSEQMAMTLDSRGFGASRTRTTFRDIAMRRDDWVVLLVMVVVTGTLLWLSLARGVGRELLGLW